MLREQNALLSATCAAALVALAAFSSPAGAAVSARSLVYSVGAEDRFCSRAQAIVSSVNATSYNIVHTAYETFVNSSAAPYEGNNTGAYNGTLALNATGGTIFLTTQQFVSHRELGATGWEYPAVISCKMKTAEAINFHFGAGVAGTQRSCRDVIQSTVADVYATLTAVEQRTLRYQQADIIYLNDTFAASGPTWLYPLPYLPRTAFIGSLDGKLRFRGPAIMVDRNHPDGGVGADKKGSYYCHLPSPEYIRAIVTGQTAPLIENPPD